MADSQFDAPVVAKTPPPEERPAPAAVVSTPYVEPDPNWLVSARSARKLFMFGMGSLAVGLAGALVANYVSSLRDALAVFVPWFFLATLALTGLAGVRALASLVLMAVAPGKVGWAEPAKMLGIAGFSLFGVFLAWMSTFAMTRGRQLRKRGKVLLPPLVPGAEWADLPLDAKVPAATREAVAAQWRENGRTEHASVAAFARLTMDLMSLGAPPSLIHAANRDAKDEIRHTELCYSIAKSLDGRDDGPGAFPESRDAVTLPKNRTMALAALAVDSLVDGALHEGQSARVIGELTRRCEDPEIRSALQELASDEGRHCEHGWDVVEWCLKEGGAPVAHALRGACAVLPSDPPTDLPPGARDGSWEKHGIHGEVLELEQHRKALARVRERIAELTSAAA